MAKRNILAVRADMIVRAVMWRTLAARLPLYLVAEYPKSGGTWFGLMLAEYLQVPFPRNRMPRLEPCLMHGHHLYHPSFRNAVWVVRDGRDVMVSAYFHLLFQNEHNHPRLVARTRAAVPFDDYDNVRQNLPSFIHYMFTDNTRGLFRFAWNEFVRSWISGGAHVVRYERLLQDPVGELGQAIRSLTGDEPDAEVLGPIIEQYSFQNMSKRRQGQENRRSFLRKGVAGDWKEKFTPEARRVFDGHAGEELISLGYEKDRGWVEQTA